MSPALAALVAELEAQGLALGAMAIDLLVKDLMSGKNVVDALNDLAMTMAEKQALALDAIVSP